MKIFLLLTILMLTVSCKKVKEGEVLPNGYYDCILTFDLTGNTNSLILKKVDSAGPEIIDFECESNSETQYSSMSVDSDKKITPGTLEVLNKMYYPTGYWYYEKENKIYYIKGTFLDSNNPSTTGTFVISKQVE